MTDLTDQRFGKLTVVRFAEKRGKAAVWECQCDCGNTVMAYGTNLTGGLTTQCKECRYLAQVDDLTGQRYGRLTVVRKSARGKGGIRWLCRCDCGNETDVSGHNLKNGDTTQCRQCANRSRAAARRTDLTGQRFGRLTVVSASETGDDGAVWICRCDCGNEVTARADHLKSGAIKSCGCLNAENNVARAIRMNTENTQRRIDGTCVATIESKTIYRNNTSGVKGVYWSKSQEYWIAKIGFKGKSYYLGSSTDFDTAVSYRKEAEEHLYGEFLDWYYREAAPRNRRKKIKHKKRVRDLTGQRFGKLTAVKPTGYVDPSNRSALWKCVCDCGRTKIASSSDLIYGLAKSCGCMPRGRKKKTEDTI